MSEENKKKGLLSSIGGGISKLGGGIKNKFQDAQHEKAVQKEFERKTTKLKIIDLTSKISIAKYVYADIDLTTSTMFVRESENLKPRDLLFNEKDNQTFIVHEVDNKLIERQYKIFDTDYPFTGYLVKYKIQD